MNDYRQHRRQEYLSRIGIAVQVGACFDMLAAIRDHLGPDFATPASFAAVEEAIANIKAEYPKDTTT